MKMIPIELIEGNRFQEVRARKPAIIVLDGRHFRLPTLSAGEREHQVEFDSAEIPTVVSCTCAEGEQGAACWAMARAFDVWRTFFENNIYFWPRGVAPVAPPGAGLHASIDEDGGLNLTTARPVLRSGEAVVLGG